jgi:hypothetical protein
VRRLTGGGGDRRLSHPRGADGENSRRRRGGGDPRRGPPLGGEGERDGRSAEGAGEDPPFSCGGGGLTTRLLSGGRGGAGSGSRSASGSGVVRGGETSSNSSSSSSSKSSPLPRGLISLKMRRRRFSRVWGEVMGMGWERVAALTRTKRVKPQTGLAEHVLLTANRDRVDVRSDSLARPAHSQASDSSQNCSPKGRFGSLLSSAWLVQGTLQMQVGCKWLLYLFETGSVEMLIDCSPHEHILYDVKYYKQIFL